MSVNEFLVRLNKYRPGFWKAVSYKMGEYYTGLYWGKKFICGIPCYEIYKHSHPDNVTNRGARQRGILETIDVISGHGFIKHDEYIKLKKLALRW